MRIRKKRLNVNYYNGNLDDLYVNGVYDDGSFNNRGRFDKGIKLYWNKVSGKWVRKKMDCYVSDKIWVYEFENLSEKIIVESFNKGDEENYRSFRFIDKVLCFISYLYKKSLLDRRFRDDGLISNKNNGVYVSRIDLIRYLGINDWKFLCKMLVDINIVSFINGGRSSYDFSKSLYRVKIKFDELGNVINRRFIENSILEKSILKEYKTDGLNLEEIENVKGVKFSISKKKLSEICEEKYNNKLDECRKEIKWGKLFYSDKDLEVRKNFIKRNDRERYYRSVIRRYNLFKDIIDEMNNGFVDYSLFKKDEFGYRFYNVINGMDKEFRRELKYDNEELVEVDMSGMYVKCLVYMFERIKFLNGKLYKKRNKNKFKELKKGGYLDFSLKEKEINKGLNGFEWDNGCLVDYEYGCYGGLENNKWNWYNRRKLFKDKYNVDYSDYNLGDCKGVSFEKLLNNINSEDEFLKMFDEYNNVINEFGDNNGEYFDDDYLRYFGVNSNVLNFSRSDNLIKNIRDYFNDRLRSEFIKGKMEYFNIDGFRYKNDKYNNYDDYIKDGNESFKIVGNEFYSEERDLEESDYKIKYKKGDKLEFRVLRKKFKIKFDIDENFRLSIENEFRKYKKNKRLKLIDRYKGYNYLSKFYDEENIIIDYDEFNEWKLKRYGKLESVKLKEDIDIDFSLDERIGFDGFIEKYKSSVLNNNKVDFYSLVKFMINYNYKERNKGKVGFEDDVYDRDFYKVLIMRLLFTQNYLVEGMKIGSSNRGVIKEIFGEECEVFIKMIKSIRFNYDEFGKRKVYKDNSELYKNISKVLSNIETDVMNFLVRRVFSNDMGILSNEFYVNIFDGFLVKKSRYNRIKLELNMVLKRDVGYMFYMK
tara:strand:- start:1755 stop:4370 length:2616 start_codon:yes stop_codon:yes gene_type:complete